MRQLWTSFWNWLDLPPVGHETALHIDLATAAIALLAFVFSIWTWRHQTKISIAAMRIERDNDLIRWINSVIETIVEIEFVLRAWVSPANEKDIKAEANSYLTELASAIDQGRLYFPEFPLDIVPGDEKQAVLPGDGPPILDDLVRIYNLVRDLDARTEASMTQVRHDLLRMKREFIRAAQAEIEPRRRLLSRREKGWKRWIKWR